jgi:hypothetical protein
MKLSSQCQHHAVQAKAPQSEQCLVNSLNTAAAGRQTQTTEKVQADWWSNTMLPAAAHTGSETACPVYTTCHENACQCKVLTQARLDAVRLYQL